MQYFVVATAIIIKEGKYLIARRSLDEEKFPGMWTVPGGTIEEKDHTEENSHGLMYEVIEEALRREVKEEVGLDIGELKYLTSIVYKKKKGFVMCLSFYAEHKSGEVVLDDELIDHAWISLSEMKKYDLITGIDEELELVEREITTNTV